MDFKALTAGSILIACLAGSTAFASVAISNKPTQNMSCSGGVCTATAKKAVLNVADLANMLASGDTTVSTGNAAKDIEIDQPVSWSSTGRLTLDAKRSVTVKKTVTVVGSGAVTINYDATNGDLMFLGKSKIDFADTDSSLVINGRPYVLAKDVASLATAIANNDGGSFAFAADYDAANEAYDESPIEGLFGTFEGLGHTIQHLNVRERAPGAEAGFFGTSGGVIRDIYLKDIDLSVAKGNYGGALVGLNGGLIVHAHASGKVRGKERAQYIGGLVGYNNPLGTIQKSSAEITIGANTVGGLVGFNGGLIDQCFATGKATSGGGGLVGNFDTGAVTNSYATGALTAGGGGLIGFGNLTITASYSTGQVVGSTSGGFVGGVVSNAVQNAYWDTDTSGQSQGCGSGDCSNITGLSDAQLKSGLPTGFDPKIWASDPKINNGYPYLINNPPQQ